MIPDIISLLVGKDITDPTKYIIQGWQAGDVNMTGTLINTDKVFSICSGTIIEVGKDNKNNLYSVSVEYEYATWVRYCMLESVYVSVGNVISRGDGIGKAYKSQLRLEYCTDDESEFPFRCGNMELYKQDPMVILDGDIDLADPEIDVYIEGLEDEDDDDEDEEIEIAPNYEDEENGEEG